MHRRDRFVKDLGAALVELVDQRIDRAFVAGDEARGKHHRVARFHARARMSVGGDSHQRRERLALAAAGEEGQLARLQKLRLGRIDIGAGRERELAEFQSQAHALGHPAPQRHHPPPHLARDLGQLADAMQMGGKDREKELAAAARDDLAQHGLYRTLRARSPGALDVGRIRHQQRHALGAQLGEALAVEEFAVDRRGIDLEVAAVHDQPGRSRYRERDRVGRGMGDADWLDAERAELEAPARLDRVHARADQPVLVEAAACEGQRHPGAIDRHVEAAQQMRQRADMIFVSMSQDDAENFEMALFEIGEIRRQHAQSERALFGEHYPGVDYDRAPGTFDHRQVEPDFAEPTQRHDPDRRGCQSVGCHHLNPTQPPLRDYIKPPISGESGNGSGRAPIGVLPSRINRQWIHLRAGGCAGCAPALGFET